MTQFKQKSPSAFKGEGGQHIFGEHGGVEFVRYLVLDSWRWCSHILCIAMMDCGGLGTNENNNGMLWMPLVSTGVYVGYQTQSRKGVFRLVIPYTPFHNSRQD